MSFYKVRIGFFLLIILILPCNEKLECLLYNNIHARCLRTFSRFLKHFFLFYSFGLEVSLVNQSLITNRSQKLRNSGTGWV